MSNPRPKRRARQYTAGSRGADTANRMGGVATMMMMSCSPRTERATASLNHQINVSIKETIEANIEDIREKIVMQAKTIKTLLREALAHSRA